MHFSTLHLQFGQKIIEGQSLAFRGNVNFLGYGIAELFPWRQDEHLVDLHHVQRVVFHETEILPVGRWNDPLAAFAYTNGALTYPKVSEFLMF